ncbi:MAG: hypothetical protein JO038_00500 [Alphaproteobacteria bacterium]|nr:hypothetical protein [Alphaproteobacteria bacterium]
MIKAQAPDCAMPATRCRCDHSEITTVLFGQFLILEGLATVADIEAALAHQKAQGGRIGENLVALGVIDGATLESALTKFHTNDALSWRPPQPSWI